MITQPHPITWVDVFAEGPLQGNLRLVVHIVRLLGTGPMGLPMSTIQAAAPMTALVMLVR